MRSQQVNILFWNSIVTWDLCQLSYRNHKNDRYTEYMESKMVGAIQWASDTSVLEDIADIFRNYNIYLNKSNINHSIIIKLTRRMLYSINNWFSHLFWWLFWLRHVYTKSVCTPMEWFRSTYIAAIYVEETYFCIWSNTDTLAYY